MDCVKNCTGKELAPWTRVNAGAGVGQAAEPLTNLPRRQPQQAESPFSTKNHGKTKSEEEGRDKKEAYASIYVQVPVLREFSVVRSRDVRLAVNRIGFYSGIFINSLLFGRGLSYRSQVAQSSASQN